MGSTVKGQDGRVMITEVELYNRKVIILMSSE
jgi:hypothetical protein